MLHCILIGPGATDRIAAVVNAGFFIDNRSSTGRVGHEISARRSPRKGTPWSGPDHESC